MIGMNNMHLETRPIEAALGTILRHNIADASGRKAFGKGHRLRADDLPALVALGIVAVRVAIEDPGDVGENVAAQRIAAAACGGGVRPMPVAHGRVNVIADGDGVVTVDVDALLRLNNLEGVAVATLRSHARVTPRQRVATIKVIPFALPEETVAAAEVLLSAAPLLAALPLARREVGLILVGSTAARVRIEAALFAPIATRVNELGSAIVATRYVPEDETLVARALQDVLALGVALVILAGETSIMDRDDVIPAGVREAGGTVEHYGAPVDPGNLLLLAYHGAVPVIGAPGCVRSRDANIVDLLLPRLLVGERLTRADIVALGHGGLV